MRLACFFSCRWNVERVYAEQLYTWLAPARTHGVFWYIHRPSLGGCERDAKKRASGNEADQTGRDDDGSMRAGAGRPARMREEEEEDEDEDEDEDEEEDLEARGTDRLEEDRSSIGQQS
ncbi:hypothetical protein GP486_007373 [Trichoglossum hirsutum]|uniref:Uncharacterized protein n=1 Tax=Trichoglossum hirsutum TaxID=265104 RepID=A0A9P8L2S1_9PEZI|nr:hypothetical protein GP486_007373 [Trichoglossum hirsutum]